MGLRAQGKLRPDQIGHLRRGVIHEHARLGGWLEHKRVLAKGELAARRLPSPIVLFQVDLCRSARPLGALGAAESADVSLASWCDGMQSADVTCLLV